MTKCLIFGLFIISGFFTIACNNQSNTNTNAAPQIQRNVTPQPDSEIAVIETADYGTMKMEFYPNIAPKMVAQFKALANSGFYNGTTIHRIDQNLGIIQGGDPNSKDDDPTNDGTGDSDKPDVPAEFTDVPFDAGIVGAARGPSPDSANSQFFIMTKRQSQFDTRYTVFGKVIEGLNNVRIIGGAPTAGAKDRPAEKIVIKSITIQSK